MAMAKVELLLTVEEGNQLISCSLGAEGKSNCREPVNRVESEQDIVVLAKEKKHKVSNMSQNKKQKTATAPDRGRSRKLSAGLNIP